ncbi:MAG: fused MFS/spermidine synthase [Labilithrix sp.]|nr:fused MFS/spermidine synthase [Labilithrix sp.]
MNEVSARALSASEARPRAHGGSAVAVFFTAGVFLSALLLFLVEPMLGKMLLPALGGSPHVWNTCMAFFQLVLLAGYAYAHFSVSRLGVRAQALVHAAVLIAPLLFLPLAPLAIETSSHDASVWRVVSILFRTAFVPFFVLSTSGPLLQRWFSYAAPGRDPYALYAASNAGSLLALVAYPLLIEPLMPVGLQNRAWAVAYIVLAALLVACSRYARHAPALEARAATSTRVPAKTIATWVVLSFVPASLLLGTTHWITTDVSPAPFLWVVPLALYLATFIVAFGKWSGVMPRWAETALYGSVLSVAFLVASRKAGMTVPFHLAAFFLVALALHGRLSRTKPDASRLTQFFLWVSVGGALAGLFNTFAAPALLRKIDFFAEYPLMLALGAALVPGGSPKASLDGVARARRVLIVVCAVALATFVALYLRRNVAGAYTAALLLPLLIVAATRRDHVRFGVAIATFVIFGSTNMQGTTTFVERTPFGILRVAASGDGRILTHGTTVHGVESDGRRDAEGRHLPGSYYHPDGPVGSLLRARADRGLAGGRVAVVGLGTGSLAYYAQPSETWAYYEIDPLVTQVARDTAYFHFLDESKARASEHVLGDARLRLQRERDHGLEILVVDAFSSDAIPTHILTREAFALYATKLAEQGVILVHVSNRHYALAPIVAAGGASVGLDAYEWSDAGSGDRFSTDWLVLGTDAAIARLALPETWKRRDATAAPWRDDFANLLGVMK